MEPDIQMELFCMLEIPFCPVSTAFNSTSWMNCIWQQKWHSWISILLQPPCVGILGSWGSFTRGSLDCATLVLRDSCHFLDPPAHGTTNNWKVIRDNVYIVIACSSNHCLVTSVSTTVFSLILWKWKLWRNSSVNWQRLLDPDACLALISGPFPSTASPTCGESDLLCKCCRW